MLGHRLAWLPLLLLLTYAAATSSTAKPHVLLVVVDDWGYANVGFHRPEGSAGEWQTPKIDELVAQGIELEQFYVHSFCTPTRSSLQTGRLPVRVQMTLDGPCNHGNGIPANMTGLATQLKAAGYASALVGKWDAGMRTPQHTPRGRGYGKALSYFSHGNWMWSQAEWLGSYDPGTAPHGAMPAPDHPPPCTRDTLPGWNANPKGCAIDLWEDDGPAYRLNGTENEELIFREYMRDIVQTRDKTTPLFLTYTPKLVHYPLQAPVEYQARFAKIADFNPHRQMYAAMTAFLDDCIGNVTGFFKTERMWESTLMIAFSDNGGYADADQPCSDNSEHGRFCLMGQSGASNWPLRGSKGTWFQGGVRVNAFISGGFLPAQLRGTSNTGLISVADVYSTLIGLAGASVVDPLSDNADPPVPPVESLDMWPFLTRQVESSPRTHLQLYAGGLILSYNGSLFKLLTGSQSGASWTTQVYPNQSTPGHEVRNARLNCSNGCVFDLIEDPRETTDLATTNQALLAHMLFELAARPASSVPPFKGVWERQNSSADYGRGNDPTCMETAFSKYAGFIGPYQDL